MPRGFATCVSDVRLSVRGESRISRSAALGSGGHPCGRVGAHMARGSGGRRTGPGPPAATRRSGRRKRRCAAGLDVGSQRARPGSSRGVAGTPAVGRSGLSIPVPVQAYTGPMNMRSSCAVASMYATTIGSEELGDPSIPPADRRPPRWISPRVRAVPRSRRPPASPLRGPGREPWPPAAAPLLRGRRCSSPGFVILGAAILCPPRSRGPVRLPPRRSDIVCQRPLLNCYPAWPAIGDPRGISAEPPNQR